MSVIKELTDQNINETLDEIGDKPLLVDFWAEWCAPCRMQGPIMEEVAKSMGDDAVVAKLNVDENPGVSNQLQIRSIPTLMIIQDRTVKDVMVGVHEKNILVQKLTGLVKKEPTVH